MFLIGLPAAFAVMASVSLPSVISAASTTTSTGLTLAVTAQRGSPGTDATASSTAKVPPNLPAAASSKVTTPATDVPVWSEPALAASVQPATAPSALR